MYPSEGNTFFSSFESKSFSKFIEQPGLKLIFPALGKVSRFVHSVRCRFSFVMNPLFPKQNWYHLLEKSKKRHCQRKISGSRTQHIDLA